MDILTLIFGLCAVVAIPLMIIFYLRSKRQKEPVWSFEARKVIGLGAESPKELQLTFAGRPVDEVAETRLIFWNRGRETINREDVVDKLRVVFSEGVTILGKPEVEIASRNAIGLSVMKANNWAVFDFKFLDHHDGGVIRILHTGIHGAPVTIDIAGTIKGCPKGITNIRKFVVPQTLSYCLRGTLPAAVALIILIPLMARGQLAGKMDESGLIFCAGLAAMFALFAVYGTLSFYRSRRFPRWSWPRK